MLERFRVFLDRPLDPRAGRTMLALATAILLGFAALFVLGGGESGRRAVSREPTATAAPRHPIAASPPAEALAPPRGERRRRVGRQDPQDEPGGAAAAAAERELASHRALQHVPYRDGGLSIRLVGARRGRALLRVGAPSVPAARRGWRAFLRRYGDSGHTYIPLFDARRRGARGRGA